MAAIIDNTQQAPLSPVSQKRKRADSETAPLSPPLSASPASPCSVPTIAEGTRLLSRAVNVLSTAATALSQVSTLYETDPVAREGLLRAVDLVTNLNEAGGKLIICGVGKSGLVGQKMVATMKSLGIGCSFMHAAEAIHGDLGDIRKTDAIMFISYSGKTGELMALLDHIPAHTPIIAITSHTHPSNCPLLDERPDAILLPAPIHELEEVSFGVCAPTTSTTVTIAVGDMLALTAAEAMHQEETKSVFKRNHPGGAIGAKARRLNDHTKEDTVSKHDGMITPPAF
ncbi:sugar isomerase [Didymella exigua CBS 183.55]|uniref:Sugar isomerase n=1 Tax=Didymella exigua CBS 183.55 TaxID=1150837 RepID=A0A6A5REZ8_9PLEO|nr:sugar isomerase [Didymella exigua CBS 183.55]KAF1925096.1 sugar isomerase [Didymella exigua CBS 183.55]